MSLKSIIISLFVLIITGLQHTYTIKQILISDGTWYKFHEKHKDLIREDIILAVVKLLSCKHHIRGFYTYKCSNSNCTHSKKVAFTCKSKACSSCGKKATAIWIHKQKNILPKGKWQHITFTIPDVLWDFFWTSRYLLNLIAKLAAECIQSIAAIKNAIPGIFIAIHTFGRDLKRNVHIHLSVFLKGLSNDGNKLVNLFFPQKELMKQWRYKIVNLFREAYYSGELAIPEKIQDRLNHTFTFNDFLNQQYQKYWHVHCAKPTNSPKQNIEYFARYVKRPAIAESRLVHYDGNNVIFKYLDHKAKTLKEKILSAEEFIAKFISHIPDVNFRIIRYYGFLSNRKRGESLPEVLSLLHQKVEEQTPPPSYNSLMEENFDVNPLKCTLCNSIMFTASIQFGITSSKKLLHFHRELALLKKI